MQSGAQTEATCNSISFGTCWPGILCPLARSFKKLLIIGRSSILWVGRSPNLKINAKSRVQFKSQHKQQSCRRHCRRKARSQLQGETNHTSRNEWQVFSHPSYAWPPLRHDHFIHHRWMRGKSSGRI